MALFYNRAFTSGRYEANISVYSGDDLPSFLSDAYPMASGKSVPGYFHASTDCDTFKIHAPLTSTSLTINLSTSSGRTIIAYRPNNTVYGSSVNGLLTIPTVGMVGEWKWSACSTSGSPRTYSTWATLGCASTSPPCDDRTFQAPIPVAQAWGDRFGGRLVTSPTNPNPAASYSVVLAENQDASFALAHNDAGCNYDLEIFGPGTMTYWIGQPIWRWTDFAPPEYGGVGTAAGLPGSAPGNYGSGGHIRAPVAGTYTARVIRRSGSGDCAYRLFIAKSPFFGEGMPAW